MERSNRKYSHRQLIDMLRFTPLTDMDVEKLNINPQKSAIQYRGYISGAESATPDDPQLFSAGTPDPYGAFAFNNGLHWESYYYDDGSVFEGTMTENFPHGKGVLSIGYVGGGGILSSATSEDVKFGDIYEGEFNMGFVHGIGKYVNHDGFMYTGEFMSGLKHGCGELKNLSPYLKRVQSGFDLNEAWELSIKEIEENKRRGTWLNDKYEEGEDPEFKGNTCTAYEISGVVEEAEQISVKSRLFRHKPDGMAQIFLQDALGTPVKTMQDPLYYPYGTLYLAPGPIAQLFPLPTDEALKNEMIKAQNLWRTIYDSHNFDPTPDLDATFKYALSMWSEAKYWRIQRDKKLANKRSRLKSINHA